MRIDCGNNSSLFVEANFRPPATPGWLRVPKGSRMGPCARRSTSRRASSAIWRLIRAEISSPLHTSRSLTRGGRGAARSF